MYIYIYNNRLTQLTVFIFKFDIQWNLGSRTPLIMNKSVHEQIFQKKKSRVTNGVSSNEHASQQQRLATR
jgi:hypothetical protein